MNKLSLQWIMILTSTGGCSGSFWTSQQPMGENDHQGGQINFNQTCMCPSTAPHMVCKFVIGYTMIHDLRHLPFRDFESMILIDFPFSWLRIFILHHPDLVLKRSREVLNPNRLPAMTRSRGAQLIHLAGFGWLCWIANWHLAFE